MTLNIFDFDDTLIRSIGPEIAEFLKKENPRFEFPDLSLINERRDLWWDHPISLNKELFDYKVHTVVKREYLKHCCEEYTKNIIITHRHPSLIPNIKEIVEANGLIFDEIFAGGRTLRTKTDILDEYLRDFKNKFPGRKKMVVEDVKIRIYEDSVYELKEYEKYLISKCYRDVEYYFVNTKYIFKLKDISMNLSDNIRMFFYANENHGVCLDK